MKREIVCNMRTGKIEMNLWAGTEDEEKRIVTGLSGTHPYVRAYGKKYYLTKKEIDKARYLQKENEKIAPIMNDIISKLF